MAKHGGDGRALGRIRMGRLAPGFETSTECVAPMIGNRACGLRGLEPVILILHPLSVS